MARISAFYGMDYPTVLKMPLRTFWSYNRQVDRLRAEDEVRKLRLASAAPHGEAATKLSETLQREIGTPVLYEKKFDSKAFEELKNKFNKPRA